ncbi:RNA-binding S4 domain-containing protein [Janthinobacterium sp. B9-8]|uniref:RNA-binding S4 domain-containing protein n=1 Tax=Janthinobacterium sp. B9-8 TaxID=1236179 RepID=UPI00061D280F|nr:RNA-binding S4 domain-containing protein [Janthinobacterium sp. B9-8]AMC34821.1 RNA-binding protein [Janthinobacterium sp. B9-8]
MIEVKSVRIDKWLWAARFFKTRSLASAAIDAGHVHLNKERIKPARLLKLADVLRVRTEQGEFEISVLALSEQRGPATVARMLYQESEESVLRRERDQEARQLAPRFEHPAGEGRPSKKWRRQLHQFEQKNSSSE